MSRIPSFQVRDGEAEQSPERRVKEDVEVLVSESFSQAKHKDLDSETRKLEDELTLAARIHAESKLKGRFRKHK